MVRRRGTPQVTTDDDAPAERRKKGTGAGRWRRALLVLGVVVVLLLVASARLFIWPPTDSPARVDAIVALGGDPSQREAHEAVTLAAAGYASDVVISLGDGHAPCPLPPPRVEVVCFRPEPVSTQGEAEYAARLAASHHWRSLMVVPQRSQSTRARLRFERCTAARLLVVPVADRPSHLFYDVVYEWGALAKALVFNRSC